MSGIDDVLAALEESFELENQRSHSGELFVFPTAEELEQFQVERLQAIVRMNGRRSSFITALAERADWYVIDAPCLRGQDLASVKVAQEFAHDHQATGFSMH